MANIKVKKKVNMYLKF